MEESIQNLQEDSRVYEVSQVIWRDLYLLYRWAVTGLGTTLDTILKLILAGEIAQNLTINGVILIFKYGILIKLWHQIIFSLRATPQFDER